MKRASKGFSGVIVLVIIAIVVAALGGVYFMSERSSSTPSTGSESTTTSTTISSNDEINSTIDDVVGRGQNLECDWELPGNTEENPFGTGKLYTTGNKGRSQISGATSGMTVEGNAIYTDKTVYSWVSVAGTTVGFKFDEEELKSMNDSMTPEEKQQAEQIRSEMIFHCVPWTPDESKFQVPTNVNFQ